MLLISTNKNKKGFIFSLDAFIASIIIFFSLQYLLYLSYSSSTYFYALRQAQVIASDTLQTIANADFEYKDSNIISQAVNSIYKKSYPTKLIAISNKIIPSHFSYAYDFYNFADGKWYTIFNSTYLPSRNIGFKKVAASSSILVVTYSSPLVQGDSPFCNVKCKGYDISTHNYTSPPNCTASKCEFYPGSTFDPGDIQIGLLRLTIWG
jgi:hypothetical protein